MTTLRPRTHRLIVLALATLLAGAPGLAELGKLTGSVQADQLRLHASLRHVAFTTHVRHELTLPNGGTVREFTNPAGQVFAVRWAGPGKPDLRSLLGDHFEAFRAANVGQTGRFERLSRRPLVADGTALKVAAGGHMGYFWGLAWLPALVPPGVQPSDLQ